MIQILYEIPEIKALAAVLFGAVFGSFLNVLIYRIPRKISIIHPGSFCPHCKNPIPWFRNIPVLSFIVLKGKCASCGAPISCQYPLIESTSVGIWLWGVFNMNLVSAFLFISFTSLLLVLSVIDIHFMLLPFSLILTGILVNVLSLVFGIASWKAVLSGTVAAVVFLGFVYLTVYLIFRKKGMGGGDILLAAMLGMWLGPYLILFAIFLSSILGLVFYFLASLKKGASRKRMMPFGPFLSLASVITYLSYHYFPGWFDWLMI